MLNATKHIIEQALYKDGDTINILSCSGHERWEPNFCRVPNIQVFSLEGEGIKPWNTKFSDLPDNLTPITIDEIPHIPFHLSLSHNPFVHINLLNQITNHVIPQINIFHTMPPFGWGKEHYLHHKPLFDLCDKHVCITNFNGISWGLDEFDTIVHGIDSEVFCLGEIKKPQVLMICNDLINRDAQCGYRLWDAIVKNIAGEIKLYGNTPGLSEPLDSLDEVVKAHQESLIYLNTSLSSPIPMTILEAMSVGTCVVSTNCSAIPDFIKDGENGFLYSPNEPEKAIEKINWLLQNPNIAREVGDRARETIKEKCNIDRFVKEWENLIRGVIDD